MASLTDTFVKVYADNRNAVAMCEICTILDYILKYHCPSSNGRKYI